jgi:hypothetical protein
VYGVVTPAVVHVTVSDGASYLHDITTTRHKYIYIYWLYGATNDEITSPTVNSS